MLKIKKLHLIQLILVYSCLIAAAWLCFNFKRLWGNTRKRPFQCYDESLSRPFIAEDAVTPQQLNFLSIYLPIIVMAVGEFSFSFCQRKRNFNSCWLFKGILQYLIVLTLFLIGLAVERILKNYGKLKMARLRPNFIAVCQPINSDGDGCHILDDTIAMNEYQCSGNFEPKWAVNTAFHSFPSGHASLSAYGMLFTVCYLQLLCQQLKSSQACLLLFIRVMQLFCILSALFVGASRVFDFRHHVSDVCAGFILGSTVALTINWYLKCNLQTITIWLREVFNRNNSTVEEGDNKVVNCLNGNELMEKETVHCSMA